MQECPLDLFFFLVFARGHNNFRALSSVLEFAPVSIIHHCSFVIHLGLGRGFGQHYMSMAQSIGL